MAVRGDLTELLAALARAPAGSESVSWAEGLRPGEVLDRFEILRELGRGGFGAVYEALDRELGRRVALKTLRPGRARDEWSDAELRREAQAAARLSHPGIVTLHEACTCEKGPYLVLELLRGETLDDRLSRGPLPVAEAVEMGLQVARALAHVHGEGLVHRDLKPGNVHLGEDGRVKLLDLGLAHLLGRKGQSAGTPAYVAPEQWRGEAVDGKADVFALGAVLFEALSGRRPFEVKEGRSAALDAAPVPALQAKVPRRLGLLVGRCLGADPAKRPTAAQVAEELLAVQRVRERPRAVRRFALLGAAGVALGVVLAAIYQWRLGPAALGTGSDGRLQVAVADVVNETGERDLDVLSGLLVTSLEQSRRLSVMTQARVLDLAIRAGRKDASRVDETIGREVGKAHAVRALLLPAIRRLGTTYSLEMRAIDPGRDVHLFTFSDRATSKEALLDLLDRLSERTRAELGEGKSDVGRATAQLGEAMTRSLEAYQHYLAGREAFYRDGLLAVALREYQEALRLDRDFAAAHSDLADLYHVYGRPDLAISHWRAADQNLARMPEKERSVLRLRRSFGTPSLESHNREEALRLANEVVKRFPDDKYVLDDAADAYNVFERTDLRDAALRRALDLDPGFSISVQKLSRLLAGRPAEALEVARRAVATRRSAANLSVLATTLHAAGATDEAAATAREALSSDRGQNSYIVRRSCFTLHQSGRDAECIPIWKRIAAEGQNTLEREYAATRLVEALFVRGRVREGLRALRSLGEPFRGDPVELTRMFRVGHYRLDSPLALEQARKIPFAPERRNWLATLGAMAEAERVDSTIRDQTAFHAGYNLRYRASRAEAQGRYAEATEVMRRCDEEIARSQNITSYQFSWASFIAELLLAAGKPDEAANVWPAPFPCRCRDPIDYAVGYPNLAIFRARAMEKLGRPGDAIPELDGVIAFWKEADPDLPLLVEAKAMRKRLASAPAPAGPRPTAAQGEAPAPSGR